MAIEQSQATGAIGGAGQGAAIGFQVGGPWGAAVGGVIGGVGGLLSGGGEKEAEQLAEDQARAIRSAQRENERRQRAEMGRGLGLAKATTYASGLQDSGSTKRYRGAMEKEYRANMAWGRQRARMEEEIARQGGRMAASDIQRGGIGQLVAGLGAAGKTAAAAGMFDPSGGALKKVEVQSKKWGT